MAASSTEAEKRAAVAIAAAKARGSNVTAMPPLPAAAVSECTQSIGAAPKPNEYTFEPTPCLMNVDAFVAAIHTIGPWPSSWEEQQPDALMAYNRLQALPLAVGGTRRGCQRVMLGIEPLVSALSPSRWDQSRCFWFGGLRTDVMARDAHRCTRLCQACRVNRTSATSLQSFFDCAHAQPQAYLRPLPATEKPARRSSASPPRPEACGLPTELQIGLRPPSLSPLLPLPAGGAASRLRLPPRPSVLAGPFISRSRTGNWCSNVSVTAAWSLEGRRRYDSWPKTSGAPFLSGAALRSHADSVLFDFESIAPPAKLSTTTGAPATPSDRATPLIVYVRAGHAVGRFFREARPHLGGRPYVLVTGGTDACAPPANLEHHLDDDPLLLAWFARNPSAVHPKLQPLPTGVDTANTSLYARALALAPSVQKDRLVYASFTLRADKSRKDREEALEAMRRIGAPAGAFWHAAPPRLPEIEDVYNTIRAHFVISPTGNGADCTRTYRALLLGTIPIISRKTNPLVASGLYAGTPVLIVDDWTQLSAAFLERRLEEITKRFAGGWERRWLFAEHWVERLRATVAAGRVPEGACAGG